MKKIQGQKKLTASGLRLTWSRNGTAIYAQLIEQVIAAIHDGRLQPGERLPSSRQLADTLGVSRTTTARALDQLLAEGYVTSEPRRGLFIAHSATDLARPSSRRSISPSRVITEPARPSRFTETASGMPHSPGETRYRLSALPDYRLFPARAWAASLRRSWLSPSREVLHGSAPGGLFVLREAIAEYLHQVRGVTVAAQQIVVTGGNRDSLSLVCHALKITAADAGWWLEAPCYPPIREAIDHYGKHARWLALDDEGLTLPPGPGPDIVVCTPCQHFPLGTGMSRQRRQAWLQRLSEGNTWMVEDDYDNEFRYEGAATVPLFQADHSEHTLLLGSFSKVMFKGLRLGYIVAPPSMCATLEASQSALGNTASLAMQPALADFMHQGNFGRHLNRMRRHYRQRRDALLVLLEEYLSTWCEWDLPAGGMHVLVRLRPPLNEALPESRVPSDKTQATTRSWDQWIAETLRHEGIAIDPLSRYYPADRGSPANRGQDILVRTGFILGFTDWNEADAHHLLGRLRNALEHLVT
ncbi:PLP-dependent aminotransferase family protein [Halomonas binhaiensis]|uniref:PLP-dependent aminotransferase family protein n=1 Tax=Halomonas binhaiensis TaxID=2562282 RepID=A0A856QTH0_9GAMM|nr:PLP-dependent aminotransferase family protein [Halomonas binhaiensis]QEM83232.2 PLP-dependent aminotransferase family protein [Halomonas binhaiensis]